MPFISGLIAAVGSVITGVGAWAAGLGVVGKALLSFGLSMGLSALAGAIGGSKQPAARPGEIAATLQVGGDIPRQAALGLVGLKGQLDFAGTMGSSSEQLVQDFLLSDGWCDGLAGVWIGDQRQTLRLVSQTGGVSHYAIDAYGATWDSEPLVQLWFYDGRPGQPAPALLVGSFGDKFEATDRFAGLCHVVTRVINIEDKFDGIPDWLFELRGYRCHDPRKDPAYGGSGSHDAGDPSTWEFSENPAVHAWNYLRGIESEGQVFMGLGTADYDLLTETFQQAATICDEAVPLEVGGSEPRYRASTVLLAGDSDHRAALAPLVQAMAGYLIERGGAFGLIAGAAQLPVATITDDDIVWSRGVKWSGSKSRTERTNEVHGQYVDPTSIWQANSYPAIVSATASAEDGERLAVKLDFGSITSVTQAQRAARIRLRETRRQASATLTAGMHLLWLEPGDWIRWTSAKFGQNRLYRIVSRELNPDDTSRLQLREIGNEVFSWSSADEQPYAPAPTPEPGPPLPSTVTNFTVQPDVVAGADGSTRPVLRLTWDPIADSRIVAVIIEYRAIGTVPATRVRDDSPADGLFILDQPPTGLDYEFRASIATVPARPVSWTGWVSIAPLRSGRWLVDVPDIMARFRADLEWLPVLQPELPVLAWNTAVTAISAEGKAEASIRRVEQVNVTQNEARATLAEQVTTRFAATEASVTEVKQSVSTLDGSVATLTTQVASKAAQADLVSLASTVTTQQSAITGLDGSVATLTTQVASKASQADLTTLSGTVSTQQTAITSLNGSVSALSTQVASKAAQADLTTLTGTVATQQSAITNLQSGKADAAALLQVEARANQASATGQFAVTAGAGPGGGSAQMKMRVAATQGGTLVDAGILIDVIGGVGQISLIAGKISFVDNSGANPFSPFVYQDGVWYLNSALHLGSSSAAGSFDVDYRGFELRDDNDVVRFRAKIV